MKIYLINPKFPVTYWGFEESNDLSGLKYTTPPLALATVAALTPSDIEVEICDENIEDIDFDKECDIVGLTAYLVQGPRAFHIAAEFRKRGKTVVLGGPMTSLAPEACAGKVDVIFFGEAEYTWKQFLEDYQKEAYQPEYTQTEKIDMRDSPVPRFDLLKLPQYSNTAIQTTRGCPFNCEFCDIVVLFGRKVRCKAVSQVIAELREVVKQPIDSIFFTDDNFIGNKKYAKELLHAIIEFNKTQSISLQYITQVSINLAKDEELLQLFYKAQFNKAFIGIETPRKSSLKEANKGQNLKTDLVADIKKIQSYNIDVSAGMIVGFDHDDPSIFQEQLDFIMETNISWAMTGILQAVPKTPLYERLKRENRLVTSTDYSALNNTALDVNIIPKNMTKEELVTGYKWLVQQLYSYENYAKRVIGNLKAYARKPTVKIYFPTLTQFKVVLRTLRYYLLTWDRKRRKFSLDILKYVFLHKPYTFHDAMVHLVSFKHLHTYVYDHLEKAVSQKANELEQSIAESRQAIATSYDELRKQADAVNKQAAVAYEELKEQVVFASKQAAVEYEGLRKQAAAVNKKAAVEYEELRKQAAATVSKHAAVVELEYEELRGQLAAVSERATLAYEELRKQAAAVSKQAATISNRVAAIYGELEKQATAVSRKAALVCEELEKTVTSISSISVIQER
jgi:radical SAM superfamily enzyme YgiQ (UPF0313 family)